MRPPLQGALVILSGVFFAPAVHAEYLLLTQVNNIDQPGAGEIDRANIDGTGQTTVTSGFDYPTGLVVDAGAGQMYWSNSHGGNITRANLDGTNETMFRSGLGFPFGLALDGAGTLYWADQTRGAINRVGIDGTNQQRVISTTTPGIIALDLPAGQIYWTNAADVTLGHGSIYRSSLNGTLAVPVVTRTNSFGIAIDPTGGKIYWTEYNGNLSNGGDIRRANLDGSDPQTLVSRLDAPVGITLDLRNGKMFWLDTGPTMGNASSDGDLRTANLDGTDPQTLVTGLSYPAQLAIVHEPQPGDANDDGRVNFADLLILAQNYGKMPATFSQGDFNRDGTVGFDDLLILAQNYDGTGAAAPSTVPEACFLPLLGTAALSLLRRRKPVGAH